MKTQKLEDIDSAIRDFTRAVSIDGRASPPELLNSLGASHLRRFEYSFKSEDIDKSINCFRKSVSDSSKGHPNKLKYLVNLGSSYEARFEFSGNGADTTNAIHYQKIALSLADKASNRPECLASLATSYDSRYVWIPPHNRDDLNKAIELDTEALELTPDGHENKPVFLNSLRSSLTSRFELLKNRSDIDRAIHLGRQAVDFTRARQPAYLDGLGMSYKHRFVYLNEPADVHEPSIHQAQEVLLVSDGREDKTIWLPHHPNLNYPRQHTDIEMAIKYLKQAVCLTPDDHTDKAIWIKNLGVLYECRFEHLGGRANIEKAAHYMKKVARLAVGAPFTRFEMARQWAKTSLEHNIGSSLEGFKQAMSLLPAVALSDGPTRMKYLRLTLEVKDFALEASAAAISLRCYDMALEWLEQGRSILWGQRRQLRAPLQDLASVDPGLAEELKHVSKKLEQLFSISENPPFYPELMLEKIAQERRRMTEKRNQLVDRARQLPGLRDFQFTRTCDLIASARDGPVFIINVHTSRCDALVSLPRSKDVAHIPLSDRFHVEATIARDGLARFLRAQGVRERGVRLCTERSTGQLKDILRMLWVDVAKPVLDFLGYTEAKPVEDLPHITWCTTGPLSFLPLHAAGDYKNEQHRLFNFAVSSYTPNLSALLKPPSSPASFQGILGVSQASTPGRSPLPQTITELARIAVHAKETPMTRLEGDSATVDATLEGMQEHSWVHLACHAIQDADIPTDSAFHLSDGRLKLLRIAQQSMGHAELAFLSACQTATGDEKMLEEAVHLAAGIIMAGYSTAIATIWSIQDRDAPDIADEVYKYLLQGGQPDARRAARALHSATSNLRNRIGEREFARWAQYIHMGL